ncbi:MAG: alpha-amylase family glycosyl hydrolase [Pseudomonadota bacterium]
MSASWWRGAVLYEIYVRSFCDSNGDGVGDLEGVTSKLPYLSDLGVDAIWITPFYKSPMCDFGYDVADYRAVDPLFGDLEDFRRLVREAHEMGLKVIIDQVWSHTSDQHTWFRESRADKTNDKSDWYVWADANPDGTPPNNWLSLFGGSAWMWDTRRRQYYLHNFLAEQPDLNFHCPDVQNALLDVAKFWFELGVDGFRLDVCNLYFHNQSLASNPVYKPGQTDPNPHVWQYHQFCRSQPENFGFLKKLRETANAHGGKILLGEIIDDGGADLLLEYTEGDDHLHMAYSFDLLREDKDSAFLNKTLRSFYDPGKGWPCWAIGNHDAPRVATRWGDEPKQLRVYAALQMALRGNPCVYQGEELGLPQATLRQDQIVDPVGVAMWPDDPGRDGCRTPMPWARDKKNAGFSSADETWLPVAAGHAELDAQSQRKDPESLFNFYKSLLALRKTQPVLRDGAIEIMDAPTGVVAFRRRNQTASLICAFNLSSEPVSLAMTEDAELLAKGLSTDAALLDGALRLGPWSFAFAKIA